MPKVLILGSGGREHAIFHKLREQNPGIAIVGAPGNPAFALNGGKAYPDLKVDNLDAIEAYAKGWEPDLTIVGPENPLALGIVNRLTRAGLTVFGPTMEAAKLESSKSFAKGVMKNRNVPTANYQEFLADPDAAKAYALENDGPMVVKADGLAGGKGVTVCQDAEQAIQAIDALMNERVHGTAGDRILIEEYLEGPECSIFAITDGVNYVYTPPIRDYKRRHRNNEGPNTGGMGAIFPIPEYTNELMKTTCDRIISPTLREMYKRGHPFRGVLYVGLCLTKKGPKVIEFNARFGDPEVLVALPMLDENLFDLLMRAATNSLNETRPARWAKGACACVVAVHQGYPESSSKGKIIQNAEQTDHGDYMIFHAGTTYQDDDLATNGGRVLDIVARGKNLGEALVRAYTGLGKVSFDGIDFREDIGREVPKTLAA